MSHRCTAPNFIPSTEIIMIITAITIFDVDTMVCAYNHSSWKVKKQEIYEKFKVSHSKYQASMGYMGHAFKNGRLWKEAQQKLTDKY